MNAALIHRHPRRRRAFSLIELVTVIVLLGILAACLGGPTLAYMNSIRSRSAATRILADIRFIQRYAMSSRSRTWITFDVANNRYTLYAEDLTNPGKANRKAVAHPLDQSTGAIQLGANTNLNVTLSSVNINSTTEVEFDSWGRPYDGNSAVLTAAGTISLSNGVTITLRPISGFGEQSG